MKLFLSLSFLLTFSLFSNAQEESKENEVELTIENRVADSVCVCLSKLDSNQLKASSSSLVSSCLQKGITQNADAIEKEHKRNRKDESQLLKEGISSSLLIRVQNVLSANCPNYKKFDKEIQKSRGNTRR
jgi:hypothetical protein